MVCETCSLARPLARDYPWNCASQVQSSLVESSLHALTGRVVRNCVAAWLYHLKIPPTYSKNFPCVPESWSPPQSSPVNSGPNEGAVSEWLKPTVIHFPESPSNFLLPETCAHDKHPTLQEHA